MRHKRLVFGVLFIGSVGLALPYEGPQIVGKSDVSWTQYCKEVDGLPFPNYNEMIVAKAAAKLSKVAPLSFYYYAGPMRAYGLNKASLPTSNEIPAETTVTAHNFLVILCGEFRDRPTLIEAKLNWVLNLHKLYTDEQQPIDYSRPLWGQISAHSYGPYLQYSQALYYSRREEIKKFKYGKYSLEEPVSAQTICETKYIMGEVIAKIDEKDKRKIKKGAKNIFPGLRRHNKALAKFSRQSEKNCSLDDLNYFYDFRGDSNFKPNSPESNGMIWYSSSITGQCQSPTTAKTGAKGISDEMCATYFKSPFLSRWNAARAGLATWIFRNQAYDDTFAAEGERVTILPQVGNLSAPFPFKIGEEIIAKYMDGWNYVDHWYKGDLGFNEIMNPGSGNIDQMNLAYERIRDAVNRHTDWYASGYDDGMGTVRDQAYSPFVASSYEMSASDEFTAPGTTVQSPSDGRKHWMFVFRIPINNWYNSKTLKQGVPVNFDTMWFDETTFGTNSLARSERAWDRLGTALENELDSIIYLHNITVDGEVSSDGSSF